MKRIISFSLLLFIQLNLFAQNVDLVRINGIPPANFRAPKYMVDPSKGDVILQHVPRYNWSHGCASTAAAMLIGYYDWHGYYDMYTGPTTDPTGHVALTNEHTYWDPGFCALSATKKFEDNLMARGHVDDFYVSYLNSGPDPYILNNWPRHTLEDCVGDFMGTSQSYWSNPDGGTTFFFYSNNQPTVDYSGHEANSTPQRDGCHGVKLFCESKGYTVVNNYNQYIAGYNGNSAGFSFSDYKQEINNDRPVLIHVIGHTMVGIGYNNNGNKILLLDTWDWDVHEMPWGQSYPSGSGSLQHYGVTVLELHSVPYGINDEVRINSGNDILHFGEYFDYTANFISYEGNSNPVSWHWSMTLKHTGGEHIIATKSNNYPDMNSYFNGSFPGTIPNYQWVRNQNGSIKGNVKVTVLDSDGYYHEDNHIFELMSGPPNPFLMSATKFGDGLILNYYSPGATTYEVHYDFDSQPPYNGTGASLGDSPIDAGSSTSIGIENLQNCTDYFFAIRGENEFGISAFSNEERIRLVEAENSHPVFYHFSDLFLDVSYVYDETNWCISKNVIVEPGATLTLNGGELFFSENSRLIVKPGGTLIINETKLQGLCGSTWQGIEVWGNSSANQWPDANGKYQQGRVVLNNATIENAVCAINLWKSDDNTKTGGIVHATGTTFKNNTKSVHALLYRNFHPTNGKEMEYNSWFDNCTFEITADYPATHTFYKHVDLNQINGIKFKGCDFSLSPDANNVSDYNQAIAAYSAGFKVEARCTSLTTPCNAWDKSTFNGFRVGVYAGNSGVNNNSYLINRALFTGNSIGVLSNNVDNAIVINSDFYSAKNQYNWEDCTYGIFVESGAGFTFEENKFFKQAGAPLSNYIGIGAFNCETVSDIYKNEFTGLTAGNYAYGKNYKGIDLYNGLEYICNINTGNWADFYVTGIDSLPTNGIQSKQGSTIMPARNTFSPSGAAYHIRNMTKNLIGYYYCESCPGHYPEYIENVTRELVTATGGCPSHYGGDNPMRKVLLSSQEKLAVETDFALADLTLQGVKNLYCSLKDGGSTPDAKFDVATALPSEMWELRAKLLGDSPHLTTEVLKLVADRTDVFTEAAIFDILAANPDELKKEELMKYIEEKENPLPDYMISILKQVAEGTSYRTVLEMEMAKYAHDRSRAAGDMIRSILNEEELDVAQLRTWLTNHGGIDAERQIIASYAHQGDYSLALALAETLPQTYQLAGDDLTGHNQFVSVLQMQQNLVTSGRNIDQLTQSEQDQLRVIAEADNAVSAPMAKAILESFYGANFTRCKPIDGTSSYKSQPANPNQLAVAYGLSITVKPNPAKEWAAFDYTLPEGVETASLEIVDANGKHVETIALKGNRGQQLIDSRTWIAGQYIYTLKVAGFTQSGKLVVVK